MDLKHLLKVHILNFLYVAACCIIVACGNRVSSDNPTLVEVKKMYNQAAEAQSSGHYDRAVQLYDRLLHYHTADTTACDSLLPIVSKAITQVMNTMQSQGKPDECVAYLRKIEKADDIFLGRMCRRDIMVTLAYALSRTEDVGGAAEIMDMAMKMPPVNPTHERLFRDYSYAAAVYFCLPERKSDVNKYGNMALHEIAKCDNKSGESWVTALLGMSYIRNGELTNAINMFKQSYSNASARNDTLSMANTLNLMANIMISWNLFDYANDYASKAVAMSAGVNDKNPKIVSNILTNKALVMAKFGYADSAAMFLDRADKYTRHLPYNSGSSDIDLVRGELMAKNDATRDKGIAILRRVVRDATSGIRTRALYLLAQEHLAHNEIALGEAALDSTVNTLSLNTSPILVNNIYEYAFDYYVSTQNNAKIIRLARELNESNKILSTGDILKQTAESIVDFKTRERAEELDWQQMQIEQKKKFIVIYTVVVMLVLVGVSVTLLIRRRYAVLKQRYAEQQLVTLSYQLEAMARDKQQLTDKIHSQQQLLNARYVQDSAQNVPDFSNVRINDKEGEERFRRMFEQLHPNFMSQLKAAVPSISRREELLAMLIALKLDNAQIENLMCIARSSINMARYRLRSKMLLAREDSLEEAIMEILKNSGGRH